MTTDWIKAYQIQVEQLTHLREQVMLAEQGFAHDDEKSQMLTQIDDLLEECREQMLKLELHIFDHDVTRRAKRLRQARADLLELDPRFVEKPQRNRIIAKIDAMLAECSAESVDFELRHHEAFPEADQILTQFRTKSSS